MPERRSHTVRAEPLSRDDGDSSRPRLRRSARNDTSDRHTGIPAGPVASTARPNADFGQRLRRCSQIGSVRTDASDGTAGLSSFSLFNDLRKPLRPEVVIS